MKCKFFKPLYFSILVTISPIASAELIDNGDGTISDTDLQIMWLKDAGMAASKTYPEVQQWVASLNASAYAGHTDWRLPGGTDPRSDPTARSDDGQYFYDAVGSEFGHLFYRELGGCAGYYIDTKCVAYTTEPNDDPDLLLFDNIPPKLPVNGTVYWTQMMSSSSPGYVWTFSLNAGSYREQAIGQNLRFRGWAVRDALIVPPAAPDLVETMVSNPPTSARRGARYKLTVEDTVKNIGTGASGPSRTSYFLSRDTTRRRSEDIFLFERAAPSLAPNQSHFKRIKGTVTIPSGVPLGEYFLIACADGNSEVSESDETNNCIASATRVTIRSWWSWLLWWRQ